MEYKIANQEIAREVARELLKVGAVKLQVENPFTWASGWKSPIYCDNRITLSYPSLRTKIKEYISEVIDAQFSEVKAIAGVATAGIPQGALVADKLSLPFLYVRSKPKGHGMENLIEGKLLPGQELVVIEDLISTGGSSIQAIKALKQEGAKVLGLISIFNYGFDVAQKNCEEAGISVTYLSDYDTLIEEALASGIIQEDEIDLLRQWRADPGHWGK